jgi:hypothetical protein
VLHEGGPAAKAGKQPWDSYGDLAAAGVAVQWADLSSPASVGNALAGLGGAFEFVVDNWSKSVEAAQPCVDAAVAWEVSNYVYVSSGGMYKGTSQPMREGDEVRGQFLLLLLALFVCPPLLPRSGERHGPARGGAPSRRARPALDLLSAPVHLRPQNQQARLRGLASPPCVHM